MDCIKVVDLEVYAHHGVLEEEKKVGQYFYVSFDVYFDFSKAAASDNLTMSISYADMCMVVKAYMTSRVYDLIETVAEGIARELLMTYPQVREVRVLLKKPSAPIGEKVAYPAIEIRRGWHNVCLSVGSNIGERHETIKSAIELIGKHQSIRVLKESILIETDPWGGVEQGPYINGAIELETLMNPKELMGYLLGVESQHGRTRDVHWGARTLDLDILLYDDVISDDAYVVLPHPYMTKRRFVLEPLCEIAPFKVHPIYNKRIIELLEECQ